MVTTTAGMKNASPLLNYTPSLYDVFIVYGYLAFAIHHHNSATFGSPPHQCLSAVQSQQQQKLITINKL